MVRLQWPRARAQTYSSHSARTRWNWLMRARIVALCFAILAITAATGGAQDFSNQPPADVIFLNAKIYTGVKMSSSQGIQRAEALAVREGRVEAIGRTEEIVKLKGPSTEVIDLVGHFALPGFNDAHVHLANAGFQQLSVDLGGVKSLAKFRERIRSRAHSAAPDEWSLGR